MKKYHVCGLGNALVDTEIEVTEKNLNELNIEKGLMTLVDEERQDFLQASLSDHLVMSKRACGGSAANTVISLSQFGGKSFLSCKVANDDNGQFYMQDLLDNGVDHNAHAQISEGITGKCLVMITDDADRTMNTFLGISSELSSADIDAEAISNSEYLYIEGYLVTGESSLHAIHEACDIARQAGTKIALSLSDPGIVEHFHASLKSIVGNGVDLLFCNEQEALNWCQTDDLDQALEHLQDSAAQFAVTLGSNGSVVFDGNDYLRAAAQPVTAIDTNGAGDMFAGAYLYGLTHGYSCLSAAVFANRAASAVVGQYGPRLHSAEYDGLKEGLN
ncbi:adenosine kinase [Porticoccaceae bacterium]|nr:adenosine kinase [Porticoccaceae bacterium]